MVIFVWDTILACGKVKTKTNNKTKHLKYYRCSWDLLSSSGRLSGIIVRSSGCFFLSAPLFYLVQGMLAYNFKPSLSATDLEYLIGLDLILEELNDKNVWIYRYNYTGYRSNHACLVQVSVFLEIWLISFEKCPHTSELSHESYPTGLSASKMNRKIPVPNKGKENSYLAKESLFLCTAWNYM